jgi:hypothetical protein
MLKHLQKFFNGDTPTHAAPAAQSKEEVTMKTDVTNDSAALAVALTENVSLRATVVSLTEQLATAKTELTELNGVVEAAKEFKANKEKAEAEAKVAARTAKLVAAVGTVAADGLQIATASMDDTAFDAVVAAITFKAAKEAASPAFKEAGVEGEASAEKLAAQAQSNRVMDYLKNITHETQAQ